MLDRFTAGRVRPTSLRRVTLPVLALLTNLSPATCTAPVFARQGLPASLLQSGQVRPVGATTTPKWHAVLERHGKTLSQARRACASGLSEACRLEAWRHFLERIADRPAWEKLEQVNRFVNRVPYAADLKTWGRVDRWAAPQDFLDRGGDCEDYAIAKYLSLRALGFRADRLLLTVAVDGTRGLTHMLLVVLLADGAVVLDNENDVVASWPAYGRYRLLYAFNEESALFPPATSEVASQRRQGNRSAGRRFQQNTRKLSEAAQARR